MSSGSGSTNLLHLPSGVQLDEADVTTARSLSYSEVQEWCSSRTKEYQTYISALRSVRQSEDPLYPEHHGLAIEDAKGITRLETSKIVDWCDSRTREYKSRIRGLRCIHNSAAPINYFLPIELLMGVFGNLRYTSLKKNRLSILYVCRSWHSVACETPQFWANMLGVHWDLQKHSPRLLKSLKTVLDRSGILTFPLSLQGFPDAFLELLSPHRHRISSLTVKIGAQDRDGPLGRLLEGGMAQLRELHVEQIGGGVGIYPDVPPFICLPSLTILHVAGPHFLPESASSSLRHLKLTRCRCHAYYLGEDDVESFDPLSYALQRCTSLETLEIKYGLPKVAEPYDGEDPPPQVPNFGSIHASHIAELPALRSLYVEDYARATAVFLSLIHFPDTTRVDVRIKGSRGALCSLRAGLPNLARAEYVRVTFLGSHVHLNVSRPGAVTAPNIDWTTLVTINPGYPYEWEPDFSLNAYAMSEVAALFAPVETVTTLVVDAFFLPNTGVGTPAQRVSSWTTLLSGFRKLERLEVPKNTSLKEIMRVAGRVAGDGSDLAGVWSGSTTDTIPESGFVFARDNGGPNLRIIVSGT